MRDAGICSPSLRNVTSDIDPAHKVVVGVENKPRRALDPHRLPISLKHTELGCPCTYLAALGELRPKSCNDTLGIVGMD